MTTPSHPSAEVRRQRRQWRNYDRMNHDNRTPLPTPLTAIWAGLCIVIIVAWVSLALPYHEPIAAPAYVQGW